MPRVGRKQVGFGGNVQDEHLDASASGIPVLILMHWAPGVPRPTGKAVGATATGLAFPGAWLSPVPPSQAGSSPAPSQPHRLQHEISICCISFQDTFGFFFLYSSNSSAKVWWFGAFFPLLCFLSIFLENTAARQHEGFLGVQRPGGKEKKAPKTPTQNLTGSNCFLPAGLLLHHPPKPIKPPKCCCSQLPTPQHP